VLTELLDTGAATDRATAFATLFRYWGLTFDDWPGATACERAAVAGLRCLHGKGNWTSLGRYDRPAVLELVDRGDSQHRVVAAALGEQQVTLDLGGSRIDVAKNDVEPYWFGDFTLLWKPPPFGVLLLRQGNSGTEVLWLREQLDRVQGVSPSATGDSPNPLFDAKLRKRVIDFQRSHALQPDGVVGEQTLIQLSAAVGDPLIPLLQRRTR
jgi:general secretion pathway protein A